MVRSDVIGHLILNHFQTDRVGLLNKFLQAGKISKVIFDAIVINRAVTVIRSIRAPGLIAIIHAVPVVVPRRQPQRGHAQVFEILKMIDDAAKIAPVIRAWVASIVSVRRRIRRAGRVQQEKRRGRLEV